MSLRNYEIVKKLSLAKERSNILIPCANILQIWA